MELYVVTGANKDFMERFKRLSAVLKMFKLPELQTTMSSFLTRVTESVGQYNLVFWSQ